MVIWSRIDGLARRLVPFALAFVLVLMTAVPWPVPGISSIEPSLALITVFFWGVNRPDLFPPVAAFLLGLVQDILAGAPLGLHALVLLAAHGMVVSQRRHLVRRPFAVVWCGFVVVAVGAGVLGWTIASIYYLTPVWPQPLVVQWVLDVAVFPPVAWLLARAQQHLLHAVP